jgi:hypothetical protein
MARLENWTVFDNVSRCTSICFHPQLYPPLSEYVRLFEELNGGRVMVRKAMCEVYFHGSYYSNVMKFSPISEEMVLPPFQECYGTSNKNNFFSDIV